MSIKPVEFQVMIPRTTSVSKIHSDAQHKEQIFQQQQSLSVQHNAEASTKKVYSQDKIKDVAIKEKEEKSRGNGENRKKKNKSGFGQASKPCSGKNNTSTIDIRL